jgi:hypothetical protein
MWLVGRTMYRDGNILVSIIKYGEIQLPLSLPKNAGDGEEVEGSGVWKEQCQRGSLCKRREEGSGQA